MIVAGIDPGSSGGISLLQEDGTLIGAFDMPAIKVKVGKTFRTRIAPSAVALLLRSHAIAHAFMEDVQPVPGNGALGHFGLGRALGVVEGVVAAFGIPVTLIRPQTWKKAMGLPAEKGNARARAMQLWPASAADFQRVRDDGRAESALIAYVGLQQQRRAA